MKTGLLIIASEVLNGKIKDLNTSLVAETLRPLGIELECQLAVPDTEESIHGALAFLSESCELIITAGGVGPTLDDITKSSLSTFFKKPIQYSTDAENVARRNYENLGRPFPGKDHPYSFLPEGFAPLSNPNGFAPGFFLSTEKLTIVSVPGVPRELRAMLDQHLPALIEAKLSSGRYFRHVTIRTRKVPEEKIFGELDQMLWEKLAEVGSVSSLPVVYGVDIGVRVEGDSPEVLQEKEKKILSIVDASPVKEAVWHLGSESVEEVILDKARKLNLKFAFAESATGGLCSNRITEIPGASSHFLGAVVCYDSEVKTALLDVSPDTIQTKNVVSEDVAREMAIGVRRRLKADVGVSVTGLAGPGGGSPEIPVGTVCIGISHGQQVRSFRYHFRGDRSLLKHRFSQAALFTLLDALEESAEN